VRFLVTFLSNIGDVPDMVASDHVHVQVAEVQAGRCEVQTIMVASDLEATPEEQMVVVHASADATENELMFVLGLRNSAERTMVLSVSASPSDLKHALNGLSEVATH